MDEKERRRFALTLESEDRMGMISDRCLHEFTLARAIAAEIARLEMRIEVLEAKLADKWP